LPPFPLHFPIPLSPQTSFEAFFPPVHPVSPKRAPFLRSFFWNAPIATSPLFFFLNPFVTLPFSPQLLRRLPFGPHVGHPPSPFRHSVKRSQSVVIVPTSFSLGSILFPEFLPCIPPQRASTASTSPNALNCSSVSFFYFSVFQIVSFLSHFGPVVPSLLPCLRAFFFSPSSFPSALPLQSSVSVRFWCNLYIPLALFLL